jgi:hypothetical protein
MALDAATKKRNLTASLEKYIQANLVTTDGLKIGFPGVPFVTRGLTSWAEMNYISIMPIIEYPKGNATDAASDYNLMFQIACFSHRKDSAGKPVNRISLFTTCDLIEGRFRLGKEIDIYDYASDPASVTSIGTMFVVNVDLRTMADARSTSSAVDLDAGTDAWVYTIILRGTAVHGNT